MWNLPWNYISLMAASVPNELGDEEEDEEAEGQKTNKEAVQIQNLLSKYKVK